MLEVKDECLRPLGERRNRASLAAIFRHFPGGILAAVKEGDARRVVAELRDELERAGRDREVEALTALIEGGEGVFLKLRKRYYTPAEVAQRVGVSRQTVVKWIERGELDAELTPGGHHRIPASAFTSRRAAERSKVRLVPARR